MSQTAKTAAAILADIGGTNARFALLEGRQVTAVQHLAVANHETAYDALAAALDLFGVGTAPRTAVLAFAGPVNTERAQMTNTGWETYAGELSRRFGFANVKLMNDYAALALGLDHFTADDRQLIGPPLAGSGQTLAVVGPGSGLGVAALIPTARHSLPLVCEGGHSTIPAADQFEAEILERLREDFGHVSAERVLAGPGLVNLYRAIARIEGQPIEAIDPAEVTRRGLDGSDALCRKALQSFCRFLGTFTGNMALTYGAQAGVYLGGGILPRFPEFLADSGFRVRFESKGRLSGYLSQIPTWLITRPDAAFTGLAVAATRFDDKG